MILALLGTLAWGVGAIGLALALVGILGRLVRLLASVVAWARRRGTHPSTSPA
jgi:hypothetical protein